MAQQQPPPAKIEDPVPIKMYGDFGDSNPAPPPYPGEPLSPNALNNQQAQHAYPNHAQVPIATGWGPYPPPPPHPPSYQYGATASSTTITVQPAQVYTQNPTRIVIVGNGCPRCHIGTLMDDFDCCAIFLAIFFFPIGILCCLAMRQKRCANCGATF